MDRTAEIERITRETEIRVSFQIDGKSECSISTGIPLFDHMLTLFGVHGHFDLTIDAKGDIEVDSHHTVEDVGIVLGSTIRQAAGNKKGIMRYGHACIPMDDALCTVTVDLSGRPYLVYKGFDLIPERSDFNFKLAREFFYALSVNAGMNLHINLLYGENEHHMLEAVFKGLGRSLDLALLIDPRITGVLSSKGRL